MTTIVVGDCTPSNKFELWDADGTLETEFELVVAKTLMCIYPNYHCFPFGGTFKLEDNVSRPDIALVAKDFSHWFVIEVELVSHSLHGHVLPQIRTFRYGEPQQDCVSVLAKAMSMDREQVKTFVKSVPRTVAVIANKRNAEWEICFQSLQVQLLTVAVFNSTNGVQAVEVEGKLIAKQEHVAYGLYFATDQALRFHHAVQIPNGEVMIDGFDGTGSAWTVTRDSSWAWVSKNQGTPDISNGVYVQIIRTFGGRFSMRQSPGSVERP